MAVFPQRMISNGDSPDLYTSANTSKNFHFFYKNSAYSTCQIAFTFSEHICTPKGINPVQINDQFAFTHLCTPNEFNFNIHSPISSVLGFHQLLRRTSDYLAAKCSTVFTSLLLVSSVLMFGARKVVDRSFIRTFPLITAACCSWT